MPNLSFDQIRDLLYRKLNADTDPYGDNGYWVADCYVDAVVYCGWNDGKCWRASYMIDDQLEVTLGEASEVMRTTEYRPIATQADFTVFSGDSDTVLWRGKIFEAGRYPDKGVTVTPDDLTAMAAGFRAMPIRVPLMVEHTETIFDEALKDIQMESVEVGDDGNTLFGFIRVPRWLDEALKDIPKKVSVGLSAAKQLVELSLVRFPRVADAELVAAFTAFAGKRHSDADVKDIQAIHDLAVSQGAACGTQMSASPKPHQEKKPMKTLKERLLALFSKSAPETLQELGLTEEAVTAAFAETPAPVTAPAIDPAIQARITALEQQNAAMANDAALKTAQQFAAGAILAHKFFPSEREELATLFVNALKADGAGTFQFSEAGAPLEGESCKALRAMVEKRPQHGLTGEAIPGGDLTQPSTFSDNPAGDPNKQAALLASTPLGQKVLAAKKGGN